IDRLRSGRNRRKHEELAHGERIRDSRLIIPAGTLGNARHCPIAEERERIGGKRICQRTGSGSCKLIGARIARSRKLLEHGVADNRSVEDAEASAENSVPVAQHPAKQCAFFGCRRISEAKTRRPVIPILCHAACRHGSTKVWIRVTYVKETSRSCAPCGNGDRKTFEAAELTARK